MRLLLLWIGRISILKGGPRPVKKEFPRTIKIDFGALRGTDLAASLFVGRNDGFDKKAMNAVVG
jgi:hypothetical protein